MKLLSYVEDENPHDHRGTRRKSRKKKKFRHSEKKTAKKRYASIVARVFSQNRGVLHTYFV